ncbi:sex-determining region Y protein [Dermacentor silvarum]|uniref:sex-determining region Y protein n=1 Tax=Dermacentor silvarum TaxID=543639 RepID=UPI0018990A1A|nr:sex-determining region Y protein [Dermacentor silvarum]
MRLDNQLSARLLDEDHEDGDSSPQQHHLGADGSLGEGQPSSSATGSASAEDHQHASGKHSAPAVTDSASTAEAATVVPDVACRRRSVAVRNPKETNQRVSSRPGKLWRSLSATSKEPYQRKAAEAAAVHRRKYPDYVYNARGARRRKEQQHRVKEVAGKLRNDGSGDQEQQPSTSTVQGQGASQFH